MPGKGGGSVWRSRTKLMQKKWTLWVEVPQWNPLLPPPSVSLVASASAATWVWRKKGKCSASRTGALAASDSSRHSRSAHGGCSAKPGCAFPVLSTSRGRGAPPPSWTEEKTLWWASIPICHQTKPRVFANCHSIHIILHTKHRNHQKFSKLLEMFTTYKTLSFLIQKKVLFQGKVL